MERATTRHLRPQLQTADPANHPAYISTTLASVDQRWEPGAGNPLVRLWSALHNRTYVKRMVMGSYMAMWLVGRAANGHSLHISDRPSIGRGACPVDGTSPAGHVVERWR